MTPQEAIVAWVQTESVLTVLRQAFPCSDCDATGEAKYSNGRGYIVPCPECWGRGFVIPDKEFER